MYTKYGNGDIEKVWGWRYGMEMFEDFDMVKNIHTWERRVY